MALNLRSSIGNENNFEWWLVLRVNGFESDLIKNVVFRGELSTRYVLNLRSIASSAKNVFYRINLRFRDLISNN